LADRHLKLIRGDDPQIRIRNSHHQS
jgi:hypothetical protein